MSINTYTRSAAPFADYADGGILNGFDRDGDVDYASDRARRLYEELGLPEESRDADTEYTLGSLPDGRWALVGLDIEGHRFAVEWAVSP